MNEVFTTLLNELIGKLDWELLYTALGAFAAKVYSYIKHKVRRNKLISLLSPDFTDTTRKRTPTIGMSVSSHTCHVLGKDRDMLILDEAHPFFDLVNLLNKNDVNVTILQTNQATDMDEVHVGGPVSNIHTNRIFCQYLKNIKWVVTSDHLEQYKSDSRLNEFDFSYVETSENEEGFLIDNQLYKYIKNREGWAIIARINSTKDIAKKTVHLLFGCGTNGTIGAVNYFLHNHIKIASENKGNSDYLGVFKVDRYGNMIEEIVWLDAKKYINK